MLVVIAEKEELELVEELGYSKFPVLITGVGALNVMYALKNIPRDTTILNIGYCGSNKIEIGTKVSVASVYTHHEKANFKELAESCLIAEKHDALAPCYTSTDFVTKTKIKEPCVFDMELAFICSMFDKVYSIKVVSDNLNKKEYDNKIKGVK